MGVEVLTPVVVKSSIFCDITPCNQFESACCLLHANFFLGVFVGTEDESAISLRNIG
jgi:hypothetical protein